MGYLYFNYYRIYNNIWNLKVTYTIILKLGYFSFNHECIFHIFEVGGAWQIQTIF